MKFVKKVLLSTATIFASIGCILQIESTLSAFFKYKTVTRTTYVTPKLMGLPSVSVCTPYADLVDFNLLINNTGSQFSNMTRHEKQYQAQEILTIKNILELSPDTSTFISSCGIRSISSRVIKTSSAVACNKIFQVKKFYTQEYICYLLEPMQFAIPYSTYTTTLDLPGMLYNIYVNVSISNMIKYVKPIMHYNCTLPVTSKQFAPVKYIDSAKELRSTYQRHVVQYLGYPFDRFICIKNSTLHSYCIEQCANTISIEQFGKVVHDLNLVFPYQYRHISKKDVINPGISQKIDIILEGCKYKCNRKACYQDYFMTYPIVSGGNKLQLHVFAPISPEVLIVFAPSISLLELFVYVMGAIGTWFGFAFIQIDFYQIYISFKNLLNRRNKVSVSVKEQLPNVIDLPIGFISQYYILKNKVLKLEYKVNRMYNRPRL